MSHPPNQTGPQFFGAKGRYRLENLIDTGRSGTLVWKAWDTVEKESCAVKVISRPLEKKYCQREILIHMSVNHMHVIRFKDFFDWGPRLCIVMEYAPNRTLLDYVASKGTIDEEEARKYCRQIISALGHLHERGIVLRDLKLENILLDSSGNVKICDFGFAKSEVMGRSDSFLGTVDYFPPELVKGKDAAKCFWWKRKLEPYDGKKVDVWGFGVCLYTMLHGQTPFCMPNDESVLGIINRIRIADKVRIPTKTTTGNNISAECVNLLKKALAIDPADRSSIEQLRMDPWIMNSKKTEKNGVEECDLTLEKSEKSAGKIVVKLVARRDGVAAGKNRVSFSAKDVSKAIGRAAGVFSCFRSCF
ncbi:hypothetical protein BSKO_06106 [Bryopsis sp. KO-2023]|nr:hypothetical protein BSKO_06106 [Bryopsis sp. KO-2023]